jgi:DNA polymerase II small subunit/DNA polymerase delta subunit B
VIAAAQSLNFSGGILTADMLDDMVNMAGGTKLPQQQSIPTHTIEEGATDLARTVAPLEPPQPVDLMLRNNLPDWNTEDFSMHASDAASDITVHYDITGNSTTEGKMADITACFNDRLQSIRKLIVQNSNLPRKHQEIARLLAESSRYQGYDNKAETERTNKFSKPG